jgi:hypothetical protein
LQQQDKPTIIPSSRTLASSNLATTLPTDLTRSAATMRSRTSYARTRLTTRLDSTYYEMFKQKKFVELHFEDCSPPLHAMILPQLHVIRLLYLLVPLCFIRLLYFLNTHVMFPFILCLRTQLTETCKVMQSSASREEVFRNWMSGHSDLTQSVDSLARSPAANLYNLCLLPSL